MKFFTMFPDDWLSGTINLTPEETGAFINLCCHYYAKDGVVPDNDQHLARICKLSTRAWRRVKQTLLEGDYITSEAGLIRQAKCDERLKLDGSFAQTQREKIQKRWAKARSDSAKFGPNLGQTTPVKIQKKRAKERSKRLNGNDTADTPVDTPVDTSPNPYSLLRKGAKAPEAASQETSPSLGAVIFSEALTYLVAKCALQEKSARPLLGKWRSEFGDDAVIAAVRAASARDDLSDPKSWIAGALRRQKHPRREGAI